MLGTIFTERSRTFTIGRVVAPRGIHRSLHRRVFASRRAPTVHAPPPCHSFMATELLHTIVCLKSSFSCPEAIPFDHYQLCISWIHRVCLLGQRDYYECLSLQLPRGVSSYILHRFELRSSEVRTLRISRAQSWNSNLEIQNDLVDFQLPNTTWVCNLTGPTSLGYMLFWRLDTAWVRDLQRPNTT